MTALDDLCQTPFHDADAPARARILSRLADTELSVALMAEPAGDTVDLRIFDLPGARVALAADEESRLAGFLGGPVAYAALPGRVLAAMLRAEGVGLLLNPGAPSEMLLDAQTLGWLETALASAPVPDEARLAAGPPRSDTVAALAGPLAERLADLRGMIAGAALAGAGEGHVLLIAGAEPARQPAIAKALSETLAFLPPQPGGVDIGFAETPPPAGALLFDLTPPPEPAPAPKPPKGPPILR
ncbi:MAG: hypothetical protein Q4G14_07375 [Paracoccus sp. (in: a-proteobacteria)]|uniref:hypothetical protein n=1 Tax=Paracoccus sp. TaxID=267 RepID=UPI0026DEB256|nr:hypothetical protein [Paracoccus sp. (in: a-proteobacteria)]MDO5613049.1 hypothetical protein [Paracoccus sp. (in: a-proteobacteria)]